MQAWLLSGFQGIESLRLGEAPAPTAGPGQIVLDVYFAALNPADAYLAVGQYPGKPSFPHILGRDAVGTVAAVGSDVTGVAVGDVRAILRSEVGVTRPGTLAERVAIDAAVTTPVPHGWTLPEAAAAPLVYMTAWQALMQWDPLPARAIVLVTGASGGVGVASVQLSHALGWRVVALSRSREKGERLRQLGAEWVYDPADVRWREQLKADLGKERVSLAVDNIGGETFPRVIDVMGMDGRISVVGRLAGPVPSFNTASLFFRRLRIGGVAVGAYTVEEAHAAWQSVLQALARTGDRPLIDHVFAFDEVPAAFARLAEGPMGKVLVQVRS